MEPKRLRRVPESEWPDVAYPPGIVAVWRSRAFLVQVFAGPAGVGVVRLSVCRTSLQASGRWEDGIAWDDLQRLKRECGYGDRAAVEVYPPDSEVVNDANMRHLWVLPEPPPFMWRAGEAR